jgi:hypothetical protein
MRSLAVDGLSDAQFETRQRRKTNSVAPYELTPWLVEVSIYPTALKKLINREVLAAGSSAPDDNKGKIPNWIKN